MPNDYKISKSNPHDFRKSTEHAAIQKRIRLRNNLYKRLQAECGIVLCYVCYEEVAWCDKSLEHKIPRVHGGTDAKSNLAISHRVCNELKAGTILPRTYEEEPELVKRLYKRQRNTYKEPSRRYKRKTKKMEQGTWKASRRDKFPKNRRR